MRYAAMVAFGTVIIGGAVFASVEEEQVAEEKDDPILAELRAISARLEQFEASREADASPDPRLDQAGVLSGGAGG